MAAIILYGLLHALAKGREKSRTKVAQALLDASATERETAIKQAIHAKDTQIRRTAYALIGEIGEQQLAPHILTGLQDRQLDVVQMAVWAMGKLKWRDGMAALQKLSDRGYGFKVMKTIVWTLGEIGDKTAVAQLEQLLPTASTRLVEGILVSGLKLGRIAFLRLIAGLDCNRAEVQTALCDTSRGSTTLRQICIQAIEQKNEPSLLAAFAYITCEVTDYQRLFADPRENVRLAVCQSIIHSLLPAKSKVALLCSLLQDDSNKVVKLAIEALADDVQNVAVFQAITDIREKHPSPKLRELAKRILSKAIQLQQLRTDLSTSGHYILETLPGLESFINKEAEALVIPLQSKRMGNGWVEVIEAEIDQLYKLHTISGIYGVTNENTKQTITIQEKQLHLLPLVRENELHRPKRRTRTTSLDWRVARAMVLCSKPTADDIVVDPTCGSGTILLDRADFGAYQELKGGDTDQTAVQIARDNLANYPQVDIGQWNASSLPLAEQSVTVIMANLPFGRRVGNHEENVALYPALIKEIVRILKQGGRAVLLTQEVTLLHDVIVAHKQVLQLEWEKAVKMGGLTPHIMVLQRV